MQQKVGAILTAEGFDTLHYPRRTFLTASAMVLMWP